MGNSNLVVEPQKRSYSIVKELGDGKYVVSHENIVDKSVLLERIFPTLQLLLEAEKKLKAMNLKSSPHYLTFNSYELVTTSNMCSKQFKAQLFYSYFEHTLRQIITERSQNNQKFTLKQIWSTFCSCVIALSHISQQDRLHYTLTPDDICISIDGQIKVLASQLSPHQFDYTFKPNYYYAPEMLKAIKSGAHIQLSNKCGVFTFAMTILHMLRLQPMSFIYCSDTLTINQSKLQAVIEEVQDQKMRSMLRKMVKVQAYDRITFTQLQQMLYDSFEDHEQTDLKSENSRLQNSIMKMSVGFQQTNATTTLSPMDNQDNLAQYTPYFSVIDIQVLDEEDNVENSQLSARNTVISQQQKISTINQIIAQQQQNNIKNQKQKQQINLGPLRQRDINHNQKVNEDSKMIKNAQKQNNFGQYVAEQYQKGRYEGYKRKGQREGFGTYYYENGAKYSGCWKNNKMNGQGTLYYPSGKVAYQGDWIDDQFHGYGVLFNQFPTTDSVQYERLDQCRQNWTKYQGQFINDRKHGAGQIQFSNGDTFKGQFKRDLPSGKGEYIRLGGKCIKGVWKDGFYQHH